MKKSRLQLHRSSCVIVISFLIGALSLSFLSVFQKIILGAPPFAPKGFLVPVIFGGLSGLFVGIYINKLKKAIEQVTIQEKNLDTMLNSIGDGVIAVDREGRIQRMNPVAERLTGWDCKDAQHMFLDEVFKIKNGQSGDFIKNPVQKVIESNEIQHITQNTVLMCKNGLEYRIEDSAAPICDAHKNCMGVILTFKDITEKNKMEELLRQRQKMESIGKLAGGIAHDFNNMLAGIIGFSEILLNKTREEKNIKYINLIIETASRATELTKNLLSFARRSDMVFKSYDVHGIIEHAIALLHRTVDKRITITHKFEASHSIISGDNSKLVNALINLGVNARDAMPAGGHLEISTQNLFLDETFCRISTFDIHHGKYVKVSVRDTGCGMDRDTAKMIFEPFFTTKEVGKGTGLGLSATYGIIKEHEGAISVYSEKGIGTVFHIYLPVNESQDAEQIWEEQQEIRGSGVILIADDEEIIRNAGKEILTDLGYDVLTAADGADCLEIYEQNKDEIDLVLLDMIMPRINGTDCFYRIKDMNPEAKVIICSGFTRDASLEELHDDGLAGFLEKPFRKIELSHTLASILSS